MTKIRDIHVQPTYAYNTNEVTGFTVFVYGRGVRVQRHFDQDTGVLYAIDVTVAAWHAGRRAKAAS